MKKEVERISALYRERVLSQRTRSVELLGKKCEPRLMETFLGVELKMGSKRLTCPDFPTARYLSLFAEAGMPAIFIPYDPTSTARLLPELEKAFRDLKEKSGLPKVGSKARLRRAYARLRESLKEAERTAGTPPSGRRP